MEHNESTAGNDQADAFGPVTLAGFALSPSGAHLFRAQHEHILRAMAGVTACIEAGLESDSGARALSARQLLTTATSMLVVHQSLEDALVRRALLAEPRMRLVVEQFEREMAPLMSEIAALSRHYPTPSSILKNSVEFGLTFTSLLFKFEERFRAEERELLSAYDRTVRVAAPGGAILVEA